MASIYLDDIIKCLNPEQKQPEPAAQPPAGTVPSAPPAPAAQDKPPETAQPQEPPKTQTDPPAQQESKGFSEFSEEFIKAFGE